MNSQELRIGNLINARHHKNEAAMPAFFWLPIEVAEIHLKYIVTPLSEIIPLTEERLKPLKLTEQWLKDFGFERDGAYWSHKYLNLHTEELKNGGEIIMIPNRKYASEVKYVHQLQNLYFALTGKELNK